MNWIKVTDRLPDVGKWYIVFERNQVNFLFYDSVDIWLHSEHGDQINYNVTHWMPLPEPPKD